VKELLSSPVIQGKRCITYSSPPFQSTTRLNRMLKKPASFVLDSSKSSTYPPRVRLRFRFACGLADSLFEHPEVPYATAPPSKMPTMYSIKLSFSTACTDVRVAAGKTKTGEAAR
jgi:hypothetical protein